MKTNHIITNLPTYSQETIDYFTKSQDYSIMTNYLFSLQMTFDDLNPISILILNYIISVSLSGEGCYASDSYLANKFCISDRTISRNIEKLIQHKLVDVIKIYTSETQQQSKRGPAKRYLVPDIGYIVSLLNNKVSEYSERLKGCTKRGIEIGE